MNFAKYGIKYTVTLYMLQSFMITLYILIYTLCFIFTYTLASFQQAYFNDGRVSPAGIYLRKVNNSNTRTRCEICSKSFMITLYILIYTLCFIFTYTLASFQQAYFNDGRVCPAGIYLRKVNNSNTRTRFEICSKLTIKRRHSGVFIVNFEHISHLVLVLLLLTLNM